MKYLLTILSCIILAGCATKSDSDKSINVDEVNYSSLSWNYGGFNGSNTKLTDVKIGSLNALGNNMSYRWVSDSNAAVGKLGSSSKTVPDLIACLFVKNKKGKWVGGKFDWISVSRTTRDFKNINTHYSGWSLSDVPNPCECAFVILNPSTKSRTNVIKGTWKR